jgi:hypothetical protein
LVNKKKQKWNTNLLIIIMKIIKQQKATDIKAMQKDIKEIKGKKKPRGLKLGF